MGRKYRRPPIIAASPQFHNQYARAFGMLATQPTFELKRGDSLTGAAKYLSVSPYFCYPSF